MANVITAFLETLVAASGDYNKAKVGKLSFLDAVFKDVKAEVARAGHTINVYFPDVGAFTDQQANDWVPEDINPNYIPVVFNQRPGKALLFRDFEQWQTAVDIKDKFLDPMFKRGLEYINGQLAAQITPANFNTYTPIVGATSGEVTVLNAAAAWKALAGNKVPVDDPGDLAILTHTDVHSNMITDHEWYQESLVGAVIAERARQTGELGVAFNFRKLYDQQAPVKTSLTNTISGTVAFTTSAATGTSTHFTTDFAVNDKFTTVGNSDTTVYTVVSITDDTHMVIRGTDAAPTTFTSTSGKAMAMANTYISVALHRYAIALGLRPLELVNNGQTQSRLLVLRDIPFRVQVSYQHQNSGYLVTVDVGCAVKVIRPDFGVLITC